MGLLKSYYADCYQKLTPLFENSSAQEFWSVLKIENLFAFNPLKRYVMDGQRPFVSRSAILQYRSVINQAPSPVKKVVLRIFERSFKRFAWWAPICRYLREHGFSGSDDVVLADIEDYSVGAGVYKAVFSNSHDKTAEVFIKREFEDQSHLRNEPFYRHLQSELIEKESLQEHSVYFENPEGPNALLSPAIPGESCEVFLSRIYQDHLNTTDVSESLEALYFEFLKHAVLGDLLGRNDRHLGNSHVLEHGREFRIIDFDSEYLLQERSTDWALQDVIQGISEVNLLGILVPGFFDAENTDVLEKYVFLTFEKYQRHWQEYTSSDAVDKIVQALETFYPQPIADEKKGIFEARLESMDPKNYSISILKRVLRDYRERMLYKRHTENQGVDEGEVFSICRHMEAFRAVFQKDFYDRHPRKGYFYWEELKKKMDEAFSRETRQDIAAVRQKIEEQSQTLLELLEAKR